MLQTPLLVVNPLVSIGLSVWLYGERFTRDPREVVLGAVSFVGWSRASSCSLAPVPA